MWRVGVAPLQQRVEAERVVPVGLGGALRVVEERAGPRATPFRMDAAAGAARQPAPAATASGVLLRRLHLLEAPRHRRLGRPVADDPVQVGAGGEDRRIGLLQEAALDRRVGRQTQAPHLGEERRQGAAHRRRGESVGEPGEGRAEPAVGRRVLPVARPRERRPQVVARRLQPPERLRLGLPGGRVRRRLEQPEVVREVAVAQPRGPVRVGDQALAAVLPQRLQQAVAHGVGARLVRSARSSASTNDVSTRRRSRASTSAAGSERRHRPAGSSGPPQTASAASSVKAPAKTREPDEQRLLGRGEQVVAPVHRRPERLLARQGRAPPAGEQAEAVVQPGGDRLDGQRPAPAARRAPGPAGCRPGAGRSRPRPGRSAR